MEFRLISFTFILIVSDSVRCQENTILDIKFNPLFRFNRELLTELIKPKSFDHALKLNIRNNKVQQQFSNETKFFCDVYGAGARSKTVPKSVHMLRPGDIDVVGAMGDSLTAANGIFALDVLQVGLEGRGASWAIGGQYSWRQFLTIPNILKEFNPKLYGYSAVDHGPSYKKSAKFNVAEPGVGS